MFKDYTLQTSKGRALVALMGGAFVGAIGITLLYLPGHLDVWTRDRPQILRFWAEIYAYNLYYFSIALFLAGPPIWFLAHRFGFRTRACASLIGLGLSLAFLIPVVLAFFFYDNLGFKSEIKTMGYWVFLFPVVVVPLIGTAVAVTIWRIAYRRPADYA